MTYEEAIEFLYDIKTDAVYNVLSVEKEALDMAIKVLEKQVPKKPVFEKDLYGGHLYCPSCKKVIMGTLLNWQPRYCNCGQVLDWSDEK